MQIAFTDLTVTRTGSSSDEHFGTSSTSWSVQGPGLDLRYVQWGTDNMSGADWTSADRQQAAAEHSALTDTLVLVTGVPEHIVADAHSRGADDQGEGVLALDDLIDPLIEHVEDSTPTDAFSQATENLRLAHDMGKIDLAATLIAMLTPAGAIGEWDSETIELVLSPAQDALEAAGIPWIGGPGNDEHRYWANVALATGDHQDYFDDGGVPNYA